MELKPFRNIIRKNKKTKLQIMSKFLKQVKKLLLLLVKGG